MTRPAPTSIAELDRRISEPDRAVTAAVESCPGNFAVLGAGGKMGLHVCQMLRRALDDLGRDDRVFAVSRFSSAGATDNFRAAAIETVSADLSRSDDYAPLPPAENVFFLAGVKFGTSSSPELLRRMNVEMPELVAEHYHTSRLVALSTGCVYSFTSPESGGSVESDPTDPPGDYARSCLGREQAFIEASRRHDTPCVLIRLNYSVEPRYGVLVDIARRVLAGEPVNLQTGYVNLIWQGDAVSQIIRSLPLGTSPPLVLNVTGTETLRVRWLAERFAERFDKPVVFEGQEAPTAWLSNSGRATKLFGNPTVDIETMIDWIAAWLLRGGPLLGKPTHFENRDGNY